MKDLLGANSDSTICPGKPRRSERRLRSGGEMASIIAADESAVTPNADWWARAYDEEWAKPAPVPCDAGLVRLIPSCLASEGDRWS